MPGVVERVAPALDAPAGAARLGLALELPDFSQVPDIADKSFVLAVAGFGVAALLKLRARKRGEGEA